MSPNEIIAPVVGVLAREPARGGMLEDAVIRQLGNRYFLVGTLAARGDGSDDERVGRVFWFALDEVVMLTEFPSISAAQESHKMRAERKQQQESPSKGKGWFG